MTIILSQKARNDIIEISYYTIEHWGYQQAKKYNSLLEEAFQNILANPYHILSKDRGHLIEHCRSFKVKKHVIFYRLKDERVEVIRILHESSDYAARLSGR